MGMRPTADERDGRIFATFTFDLLRPPTVFAVAVFMRRPVSGFFPEFFDEYAMAFLVVSTEPSGGRTCRIPHTRHRPRRIDVRREIADLGLLDGRGTADLGTDCFERVLHFQPFFIFAYCFGSTVDFDFGLQEPFALQRLMFATSELIFIESRACKWGATQCPCVESELGHLDPFASFREPQVQ